MKNQKTHMVLLLSVLLALLMICFLPVSAQDSEPNTVDAGRYVYIANGSPSDMDEKDISDSDTEGKIGILTNGFSVKKGDINTVKGGVEVITEGNDIELTVGSIFSGWGINSELYGGSLTAAAESINANKDVGLNIWAENEARGVFNIKNEIFSALGNYIWAYGDGTSVTATFGGDVTAGEEAVFTVAESANVLVDIKGNITAVDPNTFDYEFETVGISANTNENGNTKIKVGKTINVKSESEEAYDACGVRAGSTGGTTRIDAGEKINVKGVLAYGVFVDSAGGTVTIDVADDLTVNGREAFGILMNNDKDIWEEATAPIITKITVHGDVTVEGSEEGTGLLIRKADGTGTVIVDGDITGSTYGLDYDAENPGPDSYTEIVAAGIISGNQASVIVNKDVDNDNLNLIVWKIDPNTIQDEDGNPRNDIAENVNYIIRFEHDPENNLKAVDENGRDVSFWRGDLYGNPNNTVYYAKPGQKVYIVTKNGAPVLNVPNLQRDEGGFFLIIPNGGGIDIIAEVGPAPRPEPPAAPNRIDFYRIGDLSWLYDRELPGTGFSANHVTELSARPRGLTYRSTGLTLQIPGLDVAEEILMVPETDGGYSVEWLDSNIGLLEQSSYPGEGVTVLTGHNHLNTTEVGPFLFLGRLEEGDHIMINDKFNEIQTWRVYGNYKIASDGFASIADEIHENALVLITCEDEAVEGGYLNRRVILAEPM